MSIDRLFWAPEGVRKDGSTSLRKYDSSAELIAKEHPATMAHQVFLAHGGYLLDEQYVFEAAEDALWFWACGYERRLFVNGEGLSMSFDRMTLWINGEEVASRG